MAGTLIMMSCMEDGTLLKPDRPATPPDSYWQVRAFGDSLPKVKGPRGELWTTETTISNQYTWMYAFGTMLYEPYMLTLSELQASATKWAKQGKIPAQGVNTGVPEYVAFNSREGPNSVVRIFPQKKVHAGNQETEHGGADAASLHFKAGHDYGAATYHVVAPVLPNGWAVLGETLKFIPMSSQRVRSMDVNTHSVELNVVGAPGESVTFSALEPGMTVPTHFTAVVDAKGEATITMK